eukprot:7770920-Prorocentrum_lima.AAC.1
MCIRDRPKGVAKQKPAEQSVGEVGSVQTQASAAASSCIDPNASDVIANADGTSWKKLWVLHGPDGNPVQPVVVKSHTPSSGKVDKVHKGKWTAALPSIAIKNIYTTTQVPDPSSFGGRAQKWPVSLDGFQVTLPEFQQFLGTEKNQSGVTM